MNRDRVAARERRGRRTARRHRGAADASLPRHPPSHCSSQLNLAASDPSDHSPSPLHSRTAPPSQMTTPPAHGSGSPSSCASPAAAANSARSRTSATVAAAAAQAAALPAREALGTGSGLARGTASAWAPTEQPLPRPSQTGHVQPPPAAAPGGAGLWPRLGGRASLSNLGRAACSSAPLPPPLTPPLLEDEPDARRASCDAEPLHSVPGLLEASHALPGRRTAAEAGPTHARTSALQGAGAAVHARSSTSLASASAVCMELEGLSRASSAGSLLLPSRPSAPQPMPAHSHLQQPPAGAAHAGSALAPPAAHFPLSRRSSVSASRASSFSNPCRQDSVSTMARALAGGSLASTPSCASPAAHAAVMQGAAAYLSTRLSSHSSTNSLGGLAAASSGCSPAAALLPATAHPAAAGARHLTTAHHPLQHQQQQVQVERTSSSGSRSRLMEASTAVSAPGALPMLLLIRMRMVRMRVRVVTP